MSKILQFRKDFPYFKHNPNMRYLDSAATTHKPIQVIDAISNFYAYDNASVHRGVYTSAEQATVAYEQARHVVAEYIGAHDDEVIFTSGTTEGINFIAQAWAVAHLKSGDEIIITELDHHSNILPWIELERTKGIVLKYIPVLSDGTLDYEAYLGLLNPRTALVACTHTSNALGTQNNLNFIIEHAKAGGARVLVDAAQAAGRQYLKVHELDADFVVFSGHKMCGPTGIGVLYVARRMHEQLRPYQFGGGMVSEVGRHEATWLKPPQRYEAGTPPLAQAIGLAAAIDYLKSISFDELHKHEAQLCARLIAGLQALSSIKILGPIDQLKQSGHLVSFVSDKAHAHDIAAYLDRFGICVRAGNHCAQILHKKLGINASVRASFYLYSTLDDVDALLERLSEIA